jgi:hypothetical protein
MKDKTIWHVTALLVPVIALVAFMASCNEGPANTARTQNQTPSPTAPVNQEASRVPAHYEKAPPLEALGPVLPSAQFTGKTRQAYEAVKEIPITIAQLPCYCHCDRGMGHKSLHSCYEDDHAAHCAICVDEALMAYRLQKEGRSAAEIREQIIARFSQAGM